MPITTTKTCTGCFACVNICPHTCISVITDEEGFYYPHINTDTCVNCNLCNLVCTKEQTKQARYPAIILGCRVIKDSDLNSSSSGGMFGLFATAFLKSGGRIFAARFNEANKVYHDEIKDLSELAFYRRSKYSQSYLGDVFKRVKDRLKDGIRVLFVGTPCQVAGLLAFLRKPYPTLYCIDFVCHGVPSPGVWKEYLKTLGSGISNISFRDKETGWPNYSFSYVQDNVKHRQTASQNPYMRGFLHDLYLRPSCYDCKFKGFTSGADITMSDFWGVWKNHPKWNDQKGAGVLAINSNKGEQLLKMVDKKEYEEVDVTVQQAYIDYNCSAYKCAPHNPKREIFFSRYGKEPLVPLIMELSKDPILVQIKNIISKIKHKIGIKACYQALKYSFSFINKKIHGK